MVKVQAYKMVVLEKGLWLGSMKEDAETGFGWLT
jgi:hypothetical protein